MSKISLSLVLVLLSSLTFADAIYETDDRKNFYEVSKKWQDLSKSVGGIIYTDQAVEMKSHILLNPKSMSKARNLCPGSKFENEPNATSCTFFLVGKNKVVTAGHCASQKDICKEMTFVFDYVVESKAKKAKVLLSNDKVYKCKKIIAHDFKKKLDNKKVMTDLLDYALIELDRDVLDRKPLKFRYEGRSDIENFKAPALGEKIVVIGHPSGLPLKISDNAEVVESKFKNFFSTNLDVFEGSSGSPVFSQKSGEVVGILVQGQKDYSFDKTKNCNKVNSFKSGVKINNQMIGEYVSSLFQVKDLFVQKKVKPE